MLQLTLEQYIKSHPDIKFTFIYNPHGISLGGDNRCWQVKFSKPIKNKSLIGYACKTWKELVKHIINELD